jgi:hypothetical protein
VSCHSGELPAELGSEVLAGAAPMMTNLTRYVALDFDGLKPMIHSTQTCPKVSLLQNLRESSTITPFLLQFQTVSWLPKPCVGSTQTPNN